MLASERFVTGGWRYERLSGAGHGSSSSSPSG